MDGSVMCHFIRARVQIDIGLLEWMDRTNGQIAWSNSKYESLQKVCKKPKVMAAYDKSVNKYSMWMGVGAPRPLSIVLFGETVN